MKARAIQEAKKRLAWAGKAVARMRDAQNFDDFDQAWTEFLFQSHTIYNKLREGARSSGPSLGWFGRMQHERGSDSLLRYIHHARNSDEHGLANGTLANSQTWIVPLTNGELAGMTIDPESSFDRVDGPMVAGPPVLMLDISLVPVIDDEVSFAVPTDHLDESLDKYEVGPFRIAQLALDYFAKLIIQGETYVVRSDAPAASSGSSVSRLG